MMSEAVQRMGHAMVYFCDLGSGAWMCYFCPSGGGVTDCEWLLPGTGGEDYNVETET